MLLSGEILGQALEVERRGVGHPPGHSVESLHVRVLQLVQLPLDDLLHATLTVLQVVYEARVRLGPLK